MSGGRRELKWHSASVLYSAQNPCNSEPPLQKSPLLDWTAWSSHRKEWDGLSHLVLLGISFCTGRACTASFGDEFMKQIGRNLTDPFDGFLTDKKYLLMDRKLQRSVSHDSRPIGRKTSQAAAQKPEPEFAFGAILQMLKSEDLDRMILFGEKSLRRAVDSYVAHYHEERNHQGFQNQIIDPRPIFAC